MTFPTKLPNASLTQTYSLRTICFLASFSILIGSSFFTFGMSSPANHVAENRYSTVEAIHPHNHGNEIDDPYDVFSDLPRNVMQSLFVSSRPNSMVQGNPCSGRCLDPHPGAFRFWYGQQNGCWIQVWRAWPEGCQHYQWYNSCNGYWDSYPNGAPRVYWNCCVH
jgi:hypothetical protein